MFLTVLFLTQMAARITLWRFSDFLHDAKRTTVRARSSDNNMVYFQEVKMFRATAACLIACAFIAPGALFAADSQKTPALSQAAIYFPERNDWQHKRPEEVGMDSARLDLAVKSAVANENPL